MIIRKLNKKDKGVFSKESYEIGQLIYTFNPQYIEQPTRTSIQHEGMHFEDEVGRYLNHNCFPNTDIVSDGRGIHLVALDVIRKDDELTFDYNRTESKLTNPFYCGCHGLLIIGKDG